MSTFDVWLDFTCPWCYIAHHQLASANGDHQWTLRAFQLNPDLPSAGIARTTYRVNKFGSQEESDRRDDRVTEAARDVGVHIDFSKINHTPNTRNAHRAVKAIAAQGGKADLIADAILSSYFTSGADIGSPQVLVEIAEKHGAALLVTDLEPGGDYDEAIDNDIAEARSAGLSGVPFFVDTTTGQPVSTPAAISQLTHNAH